MKLVEELKSHSSKWIKTKGIRYQKFYWQNGYAAFSVNPIDHTRLIEYIENQEAHHKSSSFQEEYTTFLNEHQVKFDERYVWD